MNSQRDQRPRHLDSRRTVHGLIVRVTEAADEDRVTLADLIDVFGNRAYGTLLLFTGLVMLTPVGAIPGAPLFVTILVLLLMGQSLLRQGAPWVPARIRRIEIDSTRLRDGLNRIKPWIQWLDRITNPRLTALFDPPVIWIWSLLSMAIALTMLPLGFVPFGVAVPSLSLALIGLGIMNSDGLAALAGLGVAAAAGWIGFATLDSFPI